MAFLAIPTPENGFGFMMFRSPKRDSGERLTSSSIFPRQAKHIQPISIEHATLAVHMQAAIHWSSSG